MALMDVRMPVMDGIQAAAAIRAEPALAATKVIAVTASVMDFRERAAEQGFDDLVGKPVRVEELFETIRRHLGVRYVERGATATAPAAAVPPVSPAPRAPPAVTAAPAVPAAPPPHGTVPPGIGADVATRLRAALRLRNLTAINQLGAELTARPQTAVVGERIGELAGNFDFKGLEQLAVGLEAAAGAGASAGS